MRKFVFFISGLLLLSSCQKNVYFSDFEKLLLDIYNVGDTLIFESDKGEQDTSFILSKDIGYGSWNPLSRTGEYKLLVGTVYYGSSKNYFQGKMHPYGLLNIGKTHPDSSFMFISHNGVSASWDFETLSSTSWESQKVDDKSYIFKASNPATRFVIDGQLFFHLDYGITGYVTREGEVWKRVNFKEKRKENID